jgi:hypothetical protein
MAPNAYTAEQPHDQWWDPHNPLNDKQKAVFMDWIEQGMDFFGCDENVPKKVFSGVDAALRIPLEPHRETDPQHFDYAKLHDDLLESLMAEQSKKANDPNASVADFDSSASSFSFSSTSQHLLNTSTSTANSSFGYEEEATTTAISEMTNTSKRGHKRPRALKLHRRVMPALVNKAGDEKTMKRKLSSASSVSSKSTTNTNSNRGSPKKRTSTSDAVKVDLLELKDANYPPASSFIHPQCRLQKDKGKGEPAGSNICAKGREHCLLKLEQKMALLTRVAFGEEGKNKGKADMKRRPARIAEVFPNFTETRSIIELRMGFLSMQYGVLLRWDTTRTGKVTLVVLRKMCPESFYTVCKPPRKTKPVSPRRRMLQMPPELPSYAIRNVINGNHAILQRPDGMEVALLEPPYRVNRPEVFAPTMLSFAVQYGTGLSPASQWTVQLCYDGTTENVLMTWDPDQVSFTPKLGGTLKHEIPIDGSLDLRSLEIRLFEHRQKRGKSRRCVSHMHVPLFGLEPQPSSEIPSPRDLKVVSTHDPDACLTISVLLVSDYAHWLRQELDARRKEEVKAFVWKAPVPVRVVDIFDPTPEYDEEEDEGLWEWICGAC